jgi:hypothetical protein
MKPCDWQERVAMLLDEEDGAARQHVALCPSCAALLGELDADRELLRSMPVPEMHLAPIRRRRLAVWAWAAAAAVLFTLWLWPRPAAVEPLQIAVRAPAAPELTLPERRPEPRVAARRPRAREHRSRLAEALEAALPPLVHPPVSARGDVVVALQTEDPNVIIVLVRGDSDE